MTLTYFKYSQRSHQTLLIVSSKLYSYIIIIKNILEMKVTKTQIMTNTN